MLSAKCPVNRCVYGMMMSVLESRKLTGGHCRRNLAGCTPMFLVIDDILRGPWSWFQRPRTQESLKQRLGKMLFVGFSTQSP
jgi:hypothetical protein